MNTGGPELTCEIIVARNALKRKKQHENSLEQTNGQISMLEQQIYSIESANINQETLVAMKNAGAAMKQIHGKMTMEDVDVTMYALLFLTFAPLLHCRTGAFRCPMCSINEMQLIPNLLGNNFANNMSLRKKSAMPSPRCLSPNPLMKTNCRRILTNWSRRPWTRRCSRRGRCRWRIR